MWIPKYYFLHCHVFSFDHLSIVASGINYHLLSTHYVSGCPRGGITIIISLCPHGKHDVGANTPTVHSFLRFRKFNLL